MRLWHKDLINYLPRQQLVSQWRECCCIAKNISSNGTPNHILVNKIMEYPLEHFYTYGICVYMAMNGRGYKCNLNLFNKYFFNKNVCNEKIFKDWHNERYLDQCYYNLQEKFDCGGITEEEWNKLDKKYHELKEKYSIKREDIEKR